MAIARIINTDGGTSDSGSSGSVSLKIENLSSQVTGTETNFSTSETFISESVQVYYNGVLQIRGSNDDYIEDGDRNGVTFALAPELNSKVVVIYSVES
jgi:hypothetical protein